MKGEAIADPRVFLDRVEDLLADEARHNLMRGLVRTLIRSPESYPEFHLFLVSESSRPLAAAMQTPPYDLVVADAVGEEALSELARTVIAAGVSIDGAGGNQPTVDKFVAVWTELTGRTARLKMAQGVYVLNRVDAARPVDGAARAASDADFSLLVEWFEEFFAEALPLETAVEGRITKMVKDRLAEAGPNALWLWEVDGVPASMSGHGNPTGRGIRVGPVYTPPELRGKGYASALVAEQSQWLLDNGYDMCFLYTDLGNPTSNAIYERIGYRKVADSAMYGFAD